jgi:integrase
MDIHLSDRPAGGRAIKRMHGANPTDFYFVWRDRRNPRRVEVRINFNGQGPAELPARERSVYAVLQTSQDLINAYLRYLGLGTQSQSGTIYEYAKVLRYALEWLADSPVNILGQPVPLSLLRVGHEDAVSLLGWLTLPAQAKGARRRFSAEGLPQPEHHADPLSSSTRNLRETCLHAFYEWLIHDCSATHIVKPSRNPVKTARRRTPAPPEGKYKKAEDRGFRQVQKDDVQILEPPEWVRVLKAIPVIIRDDNQAIRAQIIFWAMTIGLMRTSELLLWDWAGINTTAVHKTMLVHTVKNRNLHPTPRKVPLPDELYRLLVQYTAEMKTIAPQAARTGRVIRQVRNENRPISDRAVEDLFQNLKQHFRNVSKDAEKRGDLQEAYSAAELSQKLHPHICRATGATFYAASGVNSNVLAEAMGHSDSSTTDKYYIASRKLEVARKLWEALPGVIEHLSGRSERKPHLKSSLELLRKYGVRSQEVR